MKRYVKAGTNLSASKEDIEQFTKICDMLLYDVYEGAHTDPDVSPTEAAEMIIDYIENFYIEDESRRDDFSDSFFSMLLHQPTQWKKFVVDYVREHYNDYEWWEYQNH